MPNLIHAGNVVINLDNVLYIVQENVSKVIVVFREGGDQIYMPILVFEGDEAREIWNQVAHKPGWQGED